MRSLDPTSIRPPFARYAHGIEVPAGARLVTISGQLGVRPDDSCPESVEEQAAQCLANIAAILAEAGMGREHVVHLRGFVTDRAFMQGYMRARDAWLAGVPVPPASTLMIVSGFTRTEFKVEVEALAAAPR